MKYWQRYIQNGGLAKRFWCQNRHVLKPGRWTGRWTMDDGRWTMDDGRWTMDDGRWTMDDGRWTMFIVHRPGFST